MQVRVVASHGFPFPNTSPRPALAHREGKGQAVCLGQAYRLAGPLAWHLAVLAATQALIQLRQLAYYILAVSVAVCLQETSWDRP